jgi:hypothetical protein
VRTTLLVLGERDPAALARVKARVGAEALATVEGASRLGWIPGIIDVALWRAVDAELGPDGLRQLARALGVRLVRSGQLSGLLQGIIQLFGLTPAAIMRWVPRAVAEVHRGVGEVRMEELGEGFARLALVDLHPCLAGEPWLAALAGSLELALEVSGMDGEAALESSGPDRAVMVLRWRPRARRA